MSEKPDDTQVGAAFDRLRNDAQGVDAMAALRRLEGPKKRTVRLVVLGTLAVAALAVVGVATLTGPDPQIVVGTAGSPSDPLLDEDVDLPVLPPEDALVGTSWLLVEGESPDGPVPLVDGWPITLVFSEAGLGGVAACNAYGANASVNGTAITIEGLGSNDAGCGEAVNASQEAFFGAIQNVEAINQDGDELVLSGEASKLRFRRDAPLPEDELIGRPWLLVELTRGDESTPAAGQPATLLLDSDGTLEGSTGCRTLSGEYSTFGASVNFTTFGAEGDCLGEALADQDGLVVTVLGDGFSAKIEGDTLTLTSQGNEGLIYTSIDEVPDQPAFAALTITDLAGTQWTLGEGIGPLGEIVSATPITLTIEPDALTGQGPCNRYGFSFDPDPEQFLGEGFVTNAGCADGSQRTAEAAYFAAFEGVTGFSVSGEFLALFGPGAELNFERTN